MLSKTFVPYPLTTAALSSGTSEAHNIIAGLGCSQKKNLQKIRWEIYSKDYPHNFS